MSSPSEGFDLFRIVAMVGALLFAVIGHEIMHGAAALLFGDTTAKDRGRLSLNPIKHIDPIGTIALPLLLLLSGSGFLFGWAKPVPIDVRRVLERGNMAMVAVSLAGIAYNLILAFCAARLLDFGSLETAAQPDFWQYFLFYLIAWNVVLAVFNLLPIPPLDGSNALAFSAAALGFYGVGRFFSRVGSWGFILLLLILATDLNAPLFIAMEAILKFMIS
jgi:Zn-dependent protease